MTQKELLEKWEGKAKNIRWLRADVDKLTGCEITFTMSAISYYKGIDKDDYDDAMWYQEKKTRAWQNILDSIKAEETSTAIRR